MSITLTVFNRSINTWLQPVEQTALRQHSPVRAIVALLIEYGVAFHHGGAVTKRSVAAGVLIETGGFYSGTLSLHRINTCILADGFSW
jgi:hypothetical protein